MAWAGGGARAGDGIRDPGRLRLLRGRPRDNTAVEEMNEAAFGPDRQQKTVYRLREGVKPIRELCFVAIDQKDRMVASIRNWPILINDKWPAVMLGPLAISPGIEGLAGRFQPNPLAGADNQCTHDGSVVTEPKVTPDYNLGGI